MGRYSAEVLVFVSVLSAVLHNAWLCLGQNSTTNCVAKEREALLRLKDDLSDQNSTLTSWKGEDCCRWEGVICDDLNGYVVKLQVTTPPPYGVEKPYPTGELNSSLLNLRYLNHLDLSGIYLKRIPKFFGSMKELKYLNLSYTEFHGEVPHQLGNLTKLKVLDIKNDYFFGGFVADIEWVSRLRSLKFLGMRGMNMSRAQHVMQIVSKLPSLSHLSLRDCSLSNIHISSHHSANSTSFKHLLHLDIGFNFILMDLGTSIIFQNMTSLVYLDLSGNSFGKSEGALFFFLKNKPYLRSLFLVDIHFKGGDIAATFRNFSEFISLEELDLSMNYIEGAFPSSLVRFTNLKYLSLSANRLNGTIPSSLAILSLIKLDLSHNQLTGSIPESLGQLHDLEVLYFSYNNFNGTIPSCFGKLSNLRDVQLSNNFLEGLISQTHFLNTSRLRLLDISNNHLSGIILGSFRKLSNLQELYLSYNFLEGLISEAHFLNMSSLKVLDISHNHLTCKMKPNWTPPFQLQGVMMDSCNFGTTFPDWIQTQVEVQFIGLSNASIFGHLPRWLDNMTFAFPDLSHNLISGTLPSWICRMQYLDLSYNKLSGRIPDCWKDSNLAFLGLSFNNLSGFIPSSIGNLNNLWLLQLNGNNLNGELPMSLQNCTNLQFLDLGENNITGNIPTWLGNGSFPYLYVLRLRENKFSGHLPSQLCSLSRLHILDLASNNLWGHIPNCVGFISGWRDVDTSETFFSSREIVVEVLKGRYDDYTNYMIMYLTNLDLSSNHLTGPIPQQLALLFELKGLNLSYNNLSGNIPTRIGEMKSLVSLDLSNNHLSGNIPTRIGEMKSLETLDLSNNHLSGRIPQSISTLTWLSHLNLSCNNFTGPIPKGSQIQTLDDPSIYANNPLLCGDLLRKKCPGVEVPLAPKISLHHEHGGGGVNIDKLENELFYVAIVLGFGTGLWGFIGVLVFKKDWRREYFALADGWIDEAYMSLVLMMAQLKRRSRSN